MTSTGPTARQFRWAAILPAVIAGLYLYLRSSDLDDPFVSAGAILLVVGLLLCGEHFGYGAQKQMARLRVARAGACTVHVTVEPYSLPFHRLNHPDRRVLLGPYLPGTPPLDQNRLLLLAVLLALSVLIMLRPRRRPAFEPVPQPA